MKTETRDALLDITYLQRDILSGIETLIARTHSPAPRDDIPVHLNPPFKPLQVMTSSQVRQLSNLLATKTTRSFDTKREMEIVLSRILPELLGYCGIEVK